MKKLQALGLALVLLFALTATTMAADEETTIAFCYQDLETQFWVAAHKAITSTLEGQGINVLEYNAHESGNRQLEQVRNAITKGVDGIIIIPQDGESALTIIEEANNAEVPIAVFNRPPASRDGDAIVVVANNRKISRKAVTYMAEQAKEKYERTGEKVKPAIVVGDLGDPNAVQRKKGFYDAIEDERFEGVFTDKVVEIPSKWDTNTCMANLQNAMQSNPDIGLLFSSSDFLFPTIRAVLAPMGKWRKAGEPGHVILGGVDGDKRAGKLIDEGYAEATGVQDLYYEAEKTLEAVLTAIENGNKTPDEWIKDPGFALTRGNLDERRMDMWGNKLRAEEGEIEE